MIIGNQVSTASSSGLHMANNAWNQATGYSGAEEDGNGSFRTHHPTTDEDEVEMLFDVDQSLQGKDSTQTSSTGNTAPSPDEKGDDDWKPF